MSSILFTIIILSTALQIAAVWLIIYAAIAWRRRSEKSAPDAGMGVVRRVYFYLVAFASLMMTASGAMLLLRFALNSLWGGETIAESSLQAAGGLALVIVGAPLWALHWRAIERAALRHPAEEIRSGLRKLYIYLTLGVSLAFAVSGAIGLLQWATRVSDFDGYPIAALVCWSAVWMFHWRVEERGGEPADDALMLRRLYIYIASLAALAMLSFGAAHAIYLILQAGYDALTATPLLATAGLSNPDLRAELIAAAVGGAAWWLHWGRIGRGDRNSELRQAYLYLFAIFGGVIAALSALAFIIHQALLWALDGWDAARLDPLPGAVAALSVGAAVWAYHWRAAYIDAAASVRQTLAARRVYTYILVGVATFAVAAAIGMLVHTAAQLLLALPRDVIIGGDAWRQPLARVAAIAAVGVPIWIHYWRDIQRRRAEIGDGERTALSRRVFIFAMLGAGVLALLGSASWLLFVFLRDLLDFSLSLDTIDEMSPFIAVIAAAAAFLPYYRSIYASDRDVAPDDIPNADATAADAAAAPDSAPDGVTDGIPDAEASAAPSPRKAVTLLIAPDGDALAQRIQTAIGYEITALRWADPDAPTPDLSDEDCAQIAQRVADAPGASALLIPSVDGVRVLSHD